MTDEEPATKRLRSSSILESQSADMVDPQGVIDVYADGDVLIVVKGVASIEKPISIRVSSHALSIGSSVFKRLLSESPTLASPEDAKTLSLPDDDGDSLLLLCNILHLRNDALPARLEPTALLAFIRTAVKYNAVVAASRSTTPWLDSIYHSKTLQFSDPILIFKMLEAAYLLNDPIYFARFSTRWVIQQTLGQMVDGVADGVAGRKRLAAELIARQKDAINTLKVDLDLLTDACAEGLADDNKHYPECAPGTDPQPEDIPHGANGDLEYCAIDKDAGTEFLSALRDANIWPATRWPNSVEAIVRLITDFRVPDFDSSEECTFCVGVVDRFATAIGMVRGMHEERLWGLCLDCYKSGGLYEGECRYDHAKAKMVDPGTLARGMSASVQSSHPGHMG